jgi:SAM-dependent methyltransferase
MRSRWLARIYEAWWRPVVFAVSGGFRVPSANAEAALVLSKIERTTGPWLDLSCGPGHLTRRLALTRTSPDPRSGAGHRPIYALDISPAMLERVRINVPSAIRVQADAAALPFADGSFGAVINLAALDLYPDAARVVAESARVLAPAGRWIASTFIRATSGGAPAAAPQRRRIDGRRRLQQIWERAAGLHTPSEQDVASYAARAGLIRFDSLRFGRYVIAWADKP